MAQVPKAVRGLLARRIDNFEKLEVVMQLRHAPDETMAADDLVERIGAPRDLLRGAVAELHADGLVSQSRRGHVQLVAEGAAAATLRELADLYETDRGLVARVLGEIALARAHSLADCAFAEAFVQRKKKKKDDDR